MIPSRDMCFILPKQINSFDLKSMNKKNKLSALLLVSGLLFLPVFFVSAEDSSGLSISSARLGIVSQIGEDFHSINSRGVGGVLAKTVEAEASLVLRSPHLENKYREFAPNESAENEGGSLFENQKENLVLSDLREKNYQPVWEAVEQFLSVLKTKI